MVTTVTTSCSGCHLVLWNAWTVNDCVLSIGCLGQLTRLVTLVFKTCFDFYGGRILYSVGCWFCCNWYIWSHWFSLDVFCNDLNGCYFSFSKSFLLNAQSIQLVVLVSTRCTLQCVDIAVIVCNVIQSVVMGTTGCTGQWFII